MQTLDAIPQCHAPKKGKQPPIQAENIKAILFDLFDTLVLTGNDHDCYVNGLVKMHGSLSYNGLESSFTEFEAAYLKVAEKIYTETATSLEEPHFKTYVVKTLEMLGFKASSEDKAIVQAVREFCKEFNQHIRVDPQAARVLKSLQVNYKIGLISNLSFPESAWELLRKFQLKSLFDFIVISGDMNLRKPHPELFNLALDSLGVTASETMFVGDTPETDIKGALNVGMIPVFINRRKIKTPDTTLKPQLTIDSLDQLLQELNQIESPIFC
jgi:HAD superfamily hydrolase (TIGR01549 family)